MTKLDQVTVGVLLALAIATAAYARHLYLKRNSPWFVVVTAYEGLPLHLRFPNLDSHSPFRAQLPRRLRVSVPTLEEKPDGSPTAEYHMRTRSMDRSLLNTFNSNRQGRFVLLETFNGYRHYYFYITPNANVGERLAAVRAAWPDHTFETEESDDPLWDWFDTYRQEHLGGA